MVQMAIDKEKVMEIYSVILDIAKIAGDIRQIEDIERVFDNYEINDPDAVLAAAEKVLAFLECYEDLEEAEDEEAGE
jgi:hypothetical protein